MRRLFVFWAALMLVSPIGCSRGPSRVEPPSVDPESAASAAFELYDTNNDGALAQDEMARCPGVLTQIKEYDQDGNGSITNQEMVDRIAAMYQHRVGLTSLICEVHVNGRPLENATVEFEPEPYLGSDLQSAHGTTNRVGNAQMAIADEHLPSDLQGEKAIQYGTFKVRITHPKLHLPSKYNSDTSLGYETKRGDPFASFPLKLP